MKHLPVVAICLVASLVISGCAQTQQWLEPRVCDCAEAVDSCDATPDDITRALVQQQVDHAYYRAQVDGEHAAEALAEAAEEEEREEAVRSPEELAMEPVDPLGEDARVVLDDEEARIAFEERHDIEAPEVGSVYRAAFESRDRSSVAIHRPGDALDLYSDGEKVASLSLESYDDELAPKELNSFRSGASDLVRDGTAQLQLIHRQTDDDGDVTFYLAIYKLIGEHIGTVLREPIATASAGEEDDTMEYLADIRFLHGIDHRIIEWIPLDNEGQPTGEPQRKEWNQWEGVYRVPEPPPTAPDQPQS